jgi:hypothetical protein
MRAVGGFRVKWLIIEIPSIPWPQLLFWYQIFQRFSTLLYAYFPSFVLKFLLIFQTENNTPYPCVS